MRGLEDPTRYFLPAQASARMIIPPSSCSKHLLPLVLNISPDVEGLFWAMSIMGEMVSNISSRGLSQVGQNLDQIQSTRYGKDPQERNRASVRDKDDTLQLSRCTEMWPLFGQPLFP